MLCKPPCAARPRSMRQLPPAPLVPYLNVPMPAYSVVNVQNADVAVMSTSNPFEQIVVCAAEMQGQSL